MLSKYMGRNEIKQNNSTSFLLILPILCWDTPTSSIILFFFIAPSCYCHVLLCLVIYFLPLHEHCILFLQWRISILYSWETLSCGFNRKQSYHLPIQWTALDCMWTSWKYCTVQYLREVQCSPAHTSE